MTDLEKASLEAFNDLLLRAGKTLRVVGQTVQGLVEFIEPEDAQYTLSTGEGQDAQVRVLKSEWPAVNKRRGSLFTVGDLHFRIKSCRADSQFYVFGCEVF